MTAVTEDCDATYATKLVGYLIIGSVIKCVRESLSENVDEKSKKRMIKAIATARNWFWPSLPVKDEAFARQFP